MERWGADTLGWYAENAGRFFDDTIAVDLTPLHERFLAVIPAGGHILDAGCGSSNISRQAPIACGAPLKSSHQGR